MLRAGNATPLGMADIIKAAAAYGVDPSLLAAFLQVECSWKPDGRLYGFAGPGMTLTRRFEKHHFSKYLPDAKTRARARGLNLITKSWKPGQKGGNQTFNTAFNLDQHATLMASSFGLSQIMGFNYKAAGFESVEAMVEYMRRSEAHQLDVTMRLMRKWGLIREMQEGDYAGMARIWNGKYYYKHGYHTKLQRAHNRLKPSFGGKPINARDEIPLDTDGVYSLGDRGKSVKELQAALGIKADGDFGPITDKAVRTFQMQHNLLVDGKVGEKTLAAINKAVAS